MPVCKRNCFAGSPTLWGALASELLMFVHILYVLPSHMLITGVVRLRNIIHSLPCEVLFLHPLSAFRLGLEPLPPAEHL